MGSNVFIIEKKTWLISKCCQKHISLTFFKLWVKGSHESFNPLTMPAGKSAYHVSEKLIFMGWLNTIRYVHLTNFKSKDVKLEELVFRSLEVVWK